jgi:hypothetical protein
MTRTFPVAILGLLAAAGFAVADEYDALIEAPPKIAADGSASLKHVKIRQDSKERVTSRVIITAAVTKETKIAMGKFNEQRKKWEATEPIKEGLNSLVFKDADTKKVLARITTSDDRKTITQILVTKVGAELASAGPDYDGVIKSVVQGGCWVLKVELDDKGEIVQTLGVSSCSTTPETKVSMGKYNAQEKKWEAGEPLEKGLYNDIFKDLGKTPVHAHFIPRPDHRGMDEIIVRKVGGQVPAKK